MSKKVYRGCMERLTEIYGSNKSLYLHNVDNVCDYDIGRIFEARDDKVAQFVDFLFTKERYPLPLITNREKQEIITNLDESDHRSSAKRAVQTQKKRLEDEVTRLRQLCHRADELRRESGKQDLYVGYPFVFGAIGRGIGQTLVKAPLLLFPVKINIKDDTTAELVINESEKIRINPVLISAYASAKKLKVGDLRLEFKDMSDFGNLRDVITYLAKGKIKIDYTPTKNIFEYTKFKEPSARGELSVRFGAVLGRFPLSNALYDDCYELEKKGLTNDSVYELMQKGGKKPTKEKKKSAKGQADANRYYATKPCDYAQLAAMRMASEEHGTAVIGPAGVGKTQTVLNIATDAITKGKHVLIVSPRKSTLDTVIGGLGELGKLTMCVTDELRERSRFYERCLTAHTSITHSKFFDVRTPENSYRELEDRRETAEKKFADAEDLFCARGEFGRSLFEMYSSSALPQKGSKEHSLYLALSENKALASMSYAEITEAIAGIRAFELEKIYYELAEAKAKYPLIEEVLVGREESILSAARQRLAQLHRAKKESFAIENHPYYRQVLVGCFIKGDEKSFAMAARRQCDEEKVGILKRKARERELIEIFRQTRKEIKEYTAEYEFLLGVLSAKGYVDAIDAVLCGNATYIKSLIFALDFCITYRDKAMVVDGLDEDRRSILGFAYDTCKNYQGYLEIIDMLTEIRIYHEAMRYEEAMAKKFASLSDYDEAVADVAKLQQIEPAIATRMCGAKCARRYADFFKSAKNGGDFVYAISKQQQYPPIKETVGKFRELLLNLFPCWILSPESASAILPLERNLFDLVIFDDASDITVDAALPATLRAKSIVVSGDPMRPRQSDKAESLLDVAMTKYDAVELTRYYRSMHGELIEFSNRAFYSSDMQIAPSPRISREMPPIVRYKVSGEWQDGRNCVEAKKVVSLLKNIITNRENDKSIGIIALSDGQRDCIVDAIYEEAAVSAAFRANIMREMQRVDGGIDKSLLIKSPSDMLTDERDIVIISVGYAKDSTGRIRADLSALAEENGEGRLNTAISRATSRVILVTSIEPEDITTDGNTPSAVLLLKKYLAYAKTVSAGDRRATEIVLGGLGKDEDEDDGAILKYDVARQMRLRLEKLGFDVRSELGHRNCGISLAIYDGESDRYLVGIEIDSDTYAADTSLTDRHVCKRLFLESRGWTILRVRCRDWWLSSAKVIKTVTAVAERQKKK